MVFMLFCLRHDFADARLFVFNELMAVTLAPGAKIIFFRFGMTLPSPTLLRQMLAVANGEAILEQWRRQYLP